MYTFELGQINLIVVGMTLVDLLFDKGIPIPFSNRRVPQGTLVGIAAAIKLTPLLFVPILLLAGKKRAARTAIASFLGAGLFASALAPRASYEYWTHFAFDVNRIGSEVWIRNQSLRGALLRLLHHHLTQHSTDPVSLGVLVVGIPLAAWCFRHSSALHGVLVGFAVEALASPVTWTHQLVWLLPLLIWLICENAQLRHGALLGAAVAIASFMGANMWAPHANSLQYCEHGWALLEADCYTIVVLCVLVGSVMMWLSARKGARSPDDGLNENYRFAKAVASDQVDPKDSSNSPPRLICS
jgi:alpha-1,2-mannosyltransferase